MYAIIVFFLPFAVILAQDQAVQDYKTGEREFGADLYKALAQSQKNSFVASPLSLTFDLSLLQSGAKGESQEQIRSGIHLPSSEKEIEDATKTLIPALTSSKKYTFNIANKIYVKKNFAINPQYKRTAAEVYQAEIENIDFSKSLQAANTINEWVSNQTHNKINNLISPSSLNNDTKTVLVNTIYMNGNWSIQFDEKATNKSDFYPTATTKVQVDTMHQGGKSHKFKHCGFLKAKFLQLDLVDGNASVIFVLPDNKSGLASLENQIDIIVPVIQDEDALSLEKVNIALPKFKIETTLLKLDKVLEQLGIKAIFDPKQADLSGVSGKKGDLVVDQVFQKTYIDIKEGGIEAAAATAILVVGTSVVIHPISLPKEFIANHPFMFFVIAQGLIVFEGKYTGPSN